MKRLEFLVIAAIAALAGCDDEPEPTCEDVENACETEGDLQCNEANDAVEACGENDDGCLVWTESEACGTGEACVVDGDTVECQPEACTDECEADETQCDGDSIMTCEEGEDGCLAWVDGEECDATASPPQTCDDSGGAAECVDACTDACETEGESQCDGTTIQNCSVGDSGCLEWVDGGDCAENEPPEVCEIVDEGAECVLECIDACDTEDATECNGTVIRTCTMGTDGCLDWVDGDDCADLTPAQSCDDTGGEAECVLGCEDDCPAADDEQCNVNVIETCTMGGDGCLHWTESSDCTELAPPRICDDTGAAPECVLSCVDECTPVDDTQCTGDVVETCTLSASDGCLHWVSTDTCDAAFEYCDPSGTDAVCVTCTNGCDTEDAQQCNVDVIETCTADANGCLDWVAGTDCTAETLPSHCEVVDGTPSCELNCADACTAGDTQCSSDLLQTCGIDAATGCLAFLTTTDCAGLVPVADCVDDGTTATCVEHVGVGTCDDPIVMWGNTLALTGTDFLATYSNNHEFTDATCTANQDGTDEVIIAVDMLAGETVLLRELGALDSVLATQETCGAAGTCSISTDLGVNESGGVRYTATTDGRVYFITEAYYVTTSTVAYDVRVDMVLPEVCDNLTDDDFNGVIDCEDPACFGVGTCADPSGTCANPVVVTTFPFTQTGTNFGTDWVPALWLDPDTCVERTGLQEDAIFEVALEAGETVTFSENGALDSVLSIMVGECSSDAGCVQSSDSAEATGLRYTATAAETVYLVVEAYTAGTSSAWDVRINVVPPENCTNTVDDDLDTYIDCADIDCFGVGACPWPTGSCGNPVVIADAPFHMSGTNFSTDWTHSMVLDAATCVERTGRQADAVFSMALVAGQTVVFSENGSLDGIVSVLVGSCGSTQACVQSYDTPETIRYTALADETVYFVVEAYTAGTTSAWDVTLTLAEDCDNTIDDDEDGAADCDDMECWGVGTCPVLGTCPTALDIDLTDGTYAGTTTGQTNAYGRASPEIWYTFTAPADGTVALRMDSTTYDTYLWLLRGDCTTPISVASNDDCAGSTRASCLTSAITAGTTYYVVVEGYSSTSYGPYTLTVDFTLPPEGDLIISEYVEGTSNMKALEFTNLSWDTIDLSAYNWANFNNGGTTPSAHTFTVGATLAFGESWVVCNTTGTVSGGGTIPDASCDQTDSVFINGDDAVVLYQGTTPIDSFGQVGFDPGAEWGVDPNTTADNTLLRNCSVITGDAVVDDVFDPAVQWTGLGVDIFTDLGVHCP